MTTREHVLALAAHLDAKSRASVMTSRQIAELNVGRGFADLVASMAREPGAPGCLIAAAVAGMHGHEEAIEGFLGRLQRLLAEVPHGDA